MTRTLATLVLVLAASQTHGDTTFVDTVAEPDSAAAIDTTIWRPGRVLVPYEDVTSPENLEQRMTQSPTLALFKSLLVPGLGQLGNRRYFKAVLFAGLDAWFIGSAVHYGRQAADFRRQFNAATAVGNRNELYDLYLDRKDERNKFTWFAVIVTFVAMFDAYVDAHLSAFPYRRDEDGIAVDACLLHDSAVSAVVTITF